MPPNGVDVLNRILIQSSAQRKHIGHPAAPGGKHWCHYNCRRRRRPLVMLWTAPPRHESAIEVGAVGTSHDSEEPGHANDYDRWQYREVSVSGSWRRSRLAGGRVSLLVCREQLNRVISAQLAKRLA